MRAAESAGGSYSVVLVPADAYVVRDADIAGMMRQKGFVLVPNKTVRTLTSAVGVIGAARSAVTVRA